jgi:uncharacterized protein YndB with AHSA1/START domain
MNPTQPVAGDAAPHVIRTVVEIAAPPERVFESLTDARELGEWWGGDDSRVVDSESDVRPGGAWQVRTVDGDGAERTVGGEYRVVDPPHHLEQSWQSTDDAEPSLVRYDLEPAEVDGTVGTRLTVTHSESFSVNALAVLAMHLSEGHRSVRVQRTVQPAWFAARHHVAWRARPSPERLTS